MRPTRRLPRSRLSAAERRRMREDVREVNFPIGLRGYDRAAVDRYVKQVNRLIAELEISSSPESAVRHALEEVSEETRELLQHAHETAEEITARSRSRADDRLQQAEREAEELRETAAREAQETREAARHETHELRATTEREARELRETAARQARELRETAEREAQQVLATARREAEETLAAAEARVQELDRNADAIWRERRRLIEDMSAVAQQQLEIAEAAEARFLRRGDVASEKAAPRQEPDVEPKPTVSDESTAPPPEVP